MRDAVNIVYFLTLSLWPMAALAAGGTLGSTLAAHPIADWIALLLVSTISGLVALLQRIRKSMEAEALSRLGEEHNRNDILRIGWRPFTLFHMSGAYVAALVAFLIAEQMDLSGYAEALSIAFSAWMGAEFMGLVAGIGTGRIANVVQAIFGPGNNPPNNQ